MRIRFKIRTLLILTALFTLPACYYGMTVQSYYMEQAALDQLREDGWVGAAMKSKINEDRPGISGYAARAINYPFQLIFGSEHNWRCTHVDLDVIASGSIEDLKALKKLQFLKSINMSMLDEDVACDACIETFLKLKRLERIELFTRNISTESHQKLQDAGVEVRHYGIRDFPTKNFMNYGGSNFRVDLKKSELFVSLVAGELGPRFSIEIYTYDALPILQVPAPCLRWLPWVKTSKPIPELIRTGGKISSNSKHDDGSNFYDGIHQSVVHNSLKLISKSANHLRINWEFETDLDRQLGKVDVELPIEEVSVQVDQSGKVADAVTGAKELFSKHFSLSDFAEPVWEEKRNMFVFRAK